MSPGSFLPYLHGQKFNIRRFLLFFCFPSYPMITHLQILSRILQSTCSCTCILVGIWITT
ncbi:uncharacterized protein K444DRAFT_605989 [Hyaloscypha bicolor E]|uniref:Uncharacterized protein n=1 Tax=Hyaloscypha bicolor E TaxID=1095630 RepID=A0A2J6TVI3_9HELO|nr:uncharacterized protein K444DRAFT_605989 [Hyaloscypha bicolor E]PMD67039.1 hypothetical protein K444DRAFT_605989 [Hyaloscypha bicolor E]